MVTEAEMEQRGPKPKNVGSLSKLKKAENSTLLREEDSLPERRNTALPAPCCSLLQGDPFQTSALQSCKVVNMCCLKPPDCDNWLQPLLHGTWGSPGSDCLADIYIPSGASLPEPWPRAGVQKHLLEFTQPGRQRGLQGHAKA